VTSDIKKIVALGVPSRVQYDCSSVTGRGSVAGSVVLENLYVRSEFQLQVIVVGVGAPSDDGERAERVGNAVLSRELIQSSGGMVNNCLNHHLWKTSER
jgi:predicted membrane GTPase involved in stress response